MDLTTEPGHIIGLVVPMVSFCEQTGQQLLIGHSHNVDACSLTCQTAQPLVGTARQNTASTVPVSTPTSPRIGTVGPGSLGTLPSGTFTRNQAASTSTGAAARAAERSTLAGGKVRLITVAVMLVSVGLGVVAV